MSHFSVNLDLCKADGACVAVCPASIIEMPEPKAGPRLVEGGEELCINCGHCVAVCPEGALSLATMASADCPPLRPEWELSPERAEHFLRARRSIRVYKKRLVPKAELERLIGIAGFAPSGHNTQARNFLVLGGREQLNPLAGMVADWMHYMIVEHPEVAGPLHMDRVVAAWEAGIDRILRGAPQVIVAHAPAADRMAPAACMLSLGYLELAAPSMGLGACWAGYFNTAAGLWPALKEALALPKGHAPLGSMMVGYPVYTYRRLPLRNQTVIAWRGEAV